MYVEDLRADFFDVLRGKRGSSKNKPRRARDLDAPDGPQRTLLLVHLDVDALCAAKILVSLFRCDQVPYTLVPVSGRSSLIRAFRDNVAAALEAGAALKKLCSFGKFLLCSPYMYVVLVNCGGTVDLVVDLGLDDEEDELHDALSRLVVFVADSHRPVDVCNVYNDGQIRLLMRQDADEAIPAYEDIFRDSDDEEEEDEEEDNDENDGGNSQNASKRRRFDESTILKRRERRLWDEKRNKILFDYQQFSFYAEPTAVQMYELAWKLSRDSNELLWLSLVASSEQHIFGKSDDRRHLAETERLRDHVARLNNRVDTEAKAVNCLKLSFDNDLCLALYRHWSIYESLQHTIYTASKFRIWTLNGRQRLCEFLAELGLPLAECKQRFSSMELQLRLEIGDIFAQKADKYGLERLAEGSFSASCGYRNRFGAADAARAALALMEHRKPGPGGEEEAFLRSLDSLTLRAGQLSLLEEGIEQAREMLEAVMQQVQTFFDLRSIVSAGPYLYAVIQDGSPNAHFFSRPATLSLLASHAIQAHAALAGRRAHGLPLVLSAPLSQQEGTCLVAGVPPITDRSRKNLLGKAFEQALKRTNCRYLLEYFDTSVVQMRTEDRSKFFDGLVSLLT